MVIEKNVVAVGPKTWMLLQECPNLIQSGTPVAADLISANATTHCGEEPSRCDFNAHVWHAG